MYNFKNLIDLLKKLNKQSSTCNFFSYGNKYFINIYNVRVVDKIFEPNIAIMNPYEDVYIGNKIIFSYEKIKELNEVYSKLENIRKEKKIKPKEFRIEYDLIEEASSVYMVIHVSDLNTKLKVPLRYINLDEEYEIHLFTQGINKIILEKPRRTLYELEPNDFLEIIKNNLNIEPHEIDFYGKVVYVPIMNSLFKSNKYSEVLLMITETTNANIYLITFILKYGQYTESINYIIM